MSFYKNYLKPWINKFGVILDVFLIGLVFIVYGGQPISQNFKHAAGELGLFLTVSVVAHLFYIFTIKKDDKYELRGLLEGKFNEQTLL